MNLSVNYMGLKLSNPLVAGASPLSDDIESAKRIEQAGAGAIVMRSLFMEQIIREQLAMAEHEAYLDTFAEALTMFPEPDEYALGPQTYLDQIKALKAALTIPVIASLNGVVAGSWTDYAKKIEEAGADALELNIYFLPLRGETVEEVEGRYVEILKAVKAVVSIPVAVKLTKHHTSPIALTKALVEAGADGVVLFNRLYQPEIDIEALEVKPHIRLSDSGDLEERVLWLAGAYGQVDATLIVSGGVHTATDALKALMAGATGVQMVSALLKGGPKALAAVKSELEQWLISHDYESLQQAIGSMSLVNSPDPEAFERANYMKSLLTYS